MLTRRLAAAALAAAADTTGLTALAALAGLDEDSAPLDPQTQGALGIPPEFTSVHVVAGQGMLRAIVLTSNGERPLRDSLARLATRLSARAPHLLWLAVANAESRDEIAIATWDGSDGPARVSALISDRSTVLDSDAETLVALSSVRGSSDLLIHARWLEILGRESLTRRFYLTLERLVQQIAAGATGRASAGERRDAALLCVSRLLFLSFLETKGWLNGDRAFLAHAFEKSMNAGGAFHRRVLAPLFFGTLNTPLSKRAATARAFGRVPFLNGGLFARSPLERARSDLLFRDEDLGALFDELLLRYRFTAREETTTFVEAAVDPEMLGRSFESLMVARERQSTGAFYTPQSLVARTTDEALKCALMREGADSAHVERALRSESIDPTLAAALRKRVGTLRVLDPACGSGAFLVHALERLATLSSSLGDQRSPSAIRRAILTASIFGVDINPTAVWLCELRLWLAMVIESEESDPMRIAPLPNLDHHVRVGDTLAGGAFHETRTPAGGSRIATLRTRYTRATGTRKRSLARLLEREERTHALVDLDTTLARVAQDRADILIAARGPDLFGARRGTLAAERSALSVLRTRARELRAQRLTLVRGGALPFAFASHFSDVGARGGFDIVLGNPPWVRLHRIARDSRDRLRGEFSVYRNAAWQAGADGARAGRGFSAQIDMAALFVERALTLANKGGTIALLVPAKLWRALAGGGVRRLVASTNTLVALEDWSDAPATFDAAVYPSLVIARRDPPQEPSTVRLTVHQRDLAISWHAPRQAVAFDETPGSPWLTLPPDARTAFDRLRAAGTPLGAAPFMRITLGVKCGCNDAFLVERLANTGAHIRVRARDRSGVVDLASLRPLARGEDVVPWTLPTPRMHIVWTHDRKGSPVDTLPPATLRWLSPWRRDLQSRSDARGRGRWWALFRTESAACDVPRVIWADVGRSPRAAVIPAGEPVVPLNSCYVARCRDLTDALTLSTLLNSPLAAAWLAAIAEPARGGFRRFLAWSVALLPLPHDWARAREILAPIGARARLGESISPEELTNAVARAYRVRPAAMTPLLEWTSY